MGLQQIVLTKNNDSPPQMESLKYFDTTEVSQYCPAIIRQILELKEVRVWTLS
jgi:hypothetical protein